MSEKDRIIEPLKYYIHEKATYDAMLAAGEIKDGVEYWIKETGEIFVFDGKFGGSTEGCIPLCRDFSDDFNNDFAR